MNLDLSLTKPPKPGDHKSRDVDGMAKPIDPKSDVRFAIGGPVKAMDIA